MSAPPGSISPSPVIGGGGMSRGNHQEYVIFNEETNFHKLGNIISSLEEEVPKMWQSINCILQKQTDGLNNGEEERKIPTGTGSSDLLTLTRGEAYKVFGVDGPAKRFNRYIHTKDPKTGAIRKQRVFNWAALSPDEIRACDDPDPNEFNRVHARFNEERFLFRYRNRPGSTVVSEARGSPDRSTFGIGGSAAQASSSRPPPLLQQLSNSRPSGAPGNGVHGSRPLSARGINGADPADPTPQPRGTRNFESRASASSSYNKFVPPRMQKEQENWRVRSAVD